MGWNYNVKSPEIVIGHWLLLYYICMAHGSMLNVLLFYAVTNDIDVISVVTMLCRHRIHCLPLSTLNSINLPYYTVN